MDGSPSSRSSNHNLVNGKNRVLYAIANDG